MTESLCYTSETYTTIVNQVYFNKNLKRFLSCEQLKTIQEFTAHETLVFLKIYIKTLC